MASGTHHEAVPGNRSHVHAQRATARREVATDHETMRALGPRTRNAAAAMASESESGLVWSVVYLVV